MKIISLLSGVAVALAITSTADAKPFGPATGAISILGSPMVTLGALSSTASFSAPVAIFSTTGDLSSASGPGTVSGTLNFSNVPLTSVPNVVTNFMTFADTSGGQYFFDVSSVETLSYFTSPSSTSITLYLLGTAGDTHLSLSAAPTSETITINKTGASAYSASATIAAPPSMNVPEPASWSLMLIGFGAAGGLMRRSRRQGAAVRA